MEEFGTDQRWIYMAEENSTLRTGNYVIELTNGPSMVYKIDPDCNFKEWVCSCPDPEKAMTVVEGLLLVENKRFYFPEATPSLNFQEKKDNSYKKKDTPPFLKRKKDK